MREDREVKQRKPDFTARDFKIPDLAMTRDEWYEYVEEHGHPPTWKPVRNHSTSQALAEQKYPNSDGTNQIPTRGMST